MMGEKLTRATALYDELSSPLKSDIRLVKERLVEDYRKNVGLMPLNDLATFNKNECQRLLMDELRQCLPGSVPDLVIEDTAFWMSNAVNNKVQDVLRNKGSHSRLQAAAATGSRVLQTLATPVSAIGRQLRRASSAFSRRRDVSDSFLDLNTGSQSFGERVNTSDRTSSPLGSQQRHLPFPETLQLSDVMADATQDDATRTAAHKDTSQTEMLQSIPESSSAAGNNSDTEVLKPVVSKKAKKPPKPKPTPSQSQLRRSRRNQATRQPPTDRPASSREGRRKPAGKQNTSVAQSQPSGSSEEVPASQTQHKTKRKAKAKDTASVNTTITLRCGLCMNWLESEETENGFWVCQTCRLVPANIRTLLDEVRSLRTVMSGIEQTNKDLVQQLAAKVVQCEELRQENALLRQGGAQAAASSSAGATPQTSLLIGDSIIRDIDSDKLVDTKVISLGGACVDDVKRKCLQSKERYARATIVVGTNDCASQDDAETILSDYKFLLQAAKEKADTVTVSSVCPRTDDTEAQGRVDIVNAELAVLCADMDCEFVNNDNNFKTSDGSVNDCYLSTDGLHLARYGTNRLARNLKLPMTGDDVTKDARRRQPQKRASGGGGSDQGRHQGGRPGTSGQKGGQNGRQNGRQNTRQNSRGEQCYNCGDDHTTDSCKLNFRVKCYSCGKLGHKAYKCRVR